MLSYIISALYYIIPVGAILFFIISFARFRDAKAKNKRKPGTYSDAQMKSRKVCFVVSAAIAGILAVVVLAFIGLLMMAVAFM